MSENISKPHTLVVAEFDPDEPSEGFDLEHLDDCPTEVIDGGPFGSYTSHTCEVGHFADADGLDTWFRHQDEPAREWDSRIPLPPGRHLIEAWSAYDPPHPGGGGEWDGGLRPIEGQCVMPVLEGRDGVLGVMPDGPEASSWWACPSPSNDPQHNVPYSEPGDCSWHETPLVEIGPDDTEVA